jgi:Reverse transcriptase (RNA-dependent DNA polymerase)
LVPSGFRLGSVLSPALFKVFFINITIIRLRIADIGCHVKGLFAGCLLNADDVILLSPSVLGLQRMLDVCCSTCTDLGLEFNGMKSHCICFGSSCKYEFSDMKLVNDYLDWTASIIYLGVTIESGKTLSFGMNNVKRSFFTACNCVFTSARNYDEIVHRPI